MNPIIEQNIIDTLKNFSELPSDKCWESIANNLPVSTPSNAPSNQQTPQNGLGNFVNSFVGKIIIAVSSIATVATVSSLIYLNQTEEKIEKIANVPSVISSDTTQTNVNPGINYENKNNSNLSSPIINTESNEHSEITNPLPSNHSTDSKENQSRPISTVDYAPKATNSTTANNIVDNNSTKHNEKNHEIVEDSNNQESVLENPIPVESKIVSEDIKIDLLKRPNVFTPNGDGYNDYLIFENLEIFPKNRLIVIDANGSKVYEQNQYNNSWDAANIPDGAYFYILEINTGQKTVSMYGALQILR